MPMPDAVTSCIVAFDANDVAAIPDQASQAVLPLTPMARFAALDRGLNALAAADFLGDSAHEAAAVRLRDIRARMDGCFGSIPLPERESLRAQFDRMIFSQLRINASLQGFESCTIRVGGEWRDLPPQQAVPKLKAELIARRSPDWLATIQRIAAPPAPWLFQFGTRVLGYAVRLLSRRGKVVTGSLKDVAGVTDAIGAQGGRVIVFEGTEGSLRDYASLLKQFIRVLNPRSPIVLRVFGAAPTQQERRHRDVAEDLDDAEAIFAAEQADPTFRQILAGYDGARDQIRKLFRTVRPTAFLSAEISRPTELLTAEAAGRQNVPRIVLGRNAQAPTEDPIAFDFKSSYLLSRYPKGLVDIALFWSGHGLAAGRQYLDPTVRKGLVADVVRQSGAVRQTGQDGRYEPARPYRILVADSFASWWTRHWWGIQTSDEYVAGLEALTALVGEMENVELVIRGKEKRECRLAALTAFLGARRNVRFEGREKPFSQSLASADLLISFFSTTIQEAVATGCPVLLFGGTRRHHYVTARCLPPRAEDRAAVYGLGPEGDLRVMVTAILDAHAGKPLTRDEQAGFVADDHAPGPVDIGRALAAGELPPLFAPPSDFEPSSEMDAPSAKSAPVQMLTAT